MMCSLQWSRCCNQLSPSHRFVSKFFWLAVCRRYIGDCVEMRIKKTWPIKASRKLGFIIGVPWLEII